MTLDQLPKDLGPLELGEICDVDGCLDDAEFFWYDPHGDELIVWNLCSEHSAKYEEVQNAL